LKRRDSSAEREDEVREFMRTLDKGDMYTFKKRRAQLKRRTDE
jgi:hypothetical protein